MIKLKEILNEEIKETYTPYMYSPVGFSCAVCVFHNQKDNIHICNNPDYQKYAGTDQLLDSTGRPITDPTKYCSNWFKPRKKPK